MFYRGQHREGSKCDTHKHQQITCHPRGQCVPVVMQQSVNVCVCGPHSFVVRITHTGYPTQHSHVYMTHLCCCHVHTQAQSRPNAETWVYPGEHKQHMTGLHRNSQYSYMTAAFFMATSDTHGFYQLTPSGHLAHRSRIMIRVQMLTSGIQASKMWATCLPNSHQLLSASISGHKLIYWLMAEVETWDIL